MTANQTSRRSFIVSSSLAAASFVGHPWLTGIWSESASQHPALHEFDYADVTFENGLHDQQLQENISILMGLSDDSLLKPLRAMSGQPAPGDELGGWYLYDPNFDGRSVGPGF